MHHSPSLASISAFSRHSSEMARYMRAMNSRTSVKTGAGSGGVGSSYSSMSFPFAFSGGRPPAGPTKADSPFKGSADAGVHLSAFFFNYRWESGSMGSMERSFAATQWKPVDTAGNHMVAQRDIGGVATVEMAMLEGPVLDCVTIGGALIEALHHRGLTDEEVADNIHISKGYMSKLIRSVWAAQLKRLIKFMRETKHLGVLQVLAREMGCEVVRLDRRAAEVAALRARLRQMGEAA